MKICLLASILLLTTACSWVTLNEQGKKVTIANKQDVQACQKVGRVFAKTRSNIVADAERNAKKVAMELSILARNEAAKIHADTIVAVTPPANGEQSFLAYHCADHSH